MLNRTTNDIDLSVVGDATELARDVSKRLQAGKVAIYSRFGTAMLKIGDNDFEFATARKESYSPDSRKPAEVIPVPIEDDLKRRDFTINALAFGLTGDKKGELIDLYDGFGDIERKIIRTPVESVKTFSDDPLRMIRAVRFAAELGFEIEADTYRAIEINRQRMEIVAGERISEEFLKMISGSDPVRAVKLLIETGLMDWIVPEITAMSGVEQVGRHHHKDVLKHSLKVMEHVVKNTDDTVLRLAALLHDIGKPTTKRFIKEQGWTFHGHEVVGARLVRKIARRLKLGKDTSQKLTKLVSLHMRPINLTSEGVTDSAIRRMMFECGDDLKDQLILCRADITSANSNLVDKYLSNFEEMWQRMQDVDARDRMRNFQSPLRGEEIMEICKLEPGPVVGELKERIEDAILDGIIPNERDAAEEYLFTIRDEVLNMDMNELNAARKKRAQARSNIDRSFKFPDE